MGASGEKRVSKTKGRRVGSDGVGWRRRRAAAAIDGACIQTQTHPDACAPAGQPLERSALQPLDEVGRRRGAWRRHWRGRRCAGLGLLCWLSQAAAAAARTVLGRWGSRWLVARVARAWARALVWRRGAHACWSRAASSRRGLTGSLECLHSQRAARLPSPRPVSPSPPYACTQVLLRHILAL